MSRSEISVPLPDGSVRRVPAGSTPADVAGSISPRLAKAAFGAVVDGTLVDLNYRLQKDAAVRIVTADSPEALSLYRHSTAHLLAAAVTNLFPGVQCGIGPATDEGFFYDFVVERPFVPEDLEAIERKMRDLAAQALVTNGKMGPEKETKCFFERRGDHLKLNLIKKKTKGRKKASCTQIK